jgi:hypothetical protein
MTKLQTCEPVEWVIRGMTHADYCCRVYLALMPKKRGM